jgi:hypothetical protein
MGPFQGPGRGPCNAIEMPWKLTALAWNKLDRDFSILTTIQKIYMTFPILSCETERNFSLPSITRNKFQSTMLEERLNYPSVLSIGNDVTNHCFVICVCVCVCVGFVMCGCFGNMCTCIYCVLYCLYCIFLLFHLCILFVLSVPV